MQYIRSIVTINLISLCMLWPILCHSLSSIAFYYGPSPPFERLSAYEAIVIMPDDTINPRNHQTSKLFAYVSVGEITQKEEARLRIKPAWIIGKNPIWRTSVLDQANPEWQKFFINQIIKPLWERGYRGFFLDTLDSYTLGAQQPIEKTRQMNGLVTLIKTIHQTYPGVKLIFNRGFELIPYLRNEVYAVAAESLFAGWNETKKKYEPVTDQERKSLIEQLKIIQNAHIPVISIDYLPPGHQKEAQVIARKITALGFIPWITEGYLNTVGQGLIRTLPKKMFVIYSKNADTIFNPSVHILLSFPLQYMGYAMEYHNVTEKLPVIFNPEEYAGIIVWATPVKTKDKMQLHQWLVERLTTAKTLPIVFFDGFGFDMTADLLAPFDLKISPINRIRSVRVSKKDKKVIGYEVDPHFNYREFIPLETKTGRVQMQLATSQNQIQDGVAITPWGGYALNNFVELGTPEGKSFWILNPFTWLKQALRLPALPVLDLTTENGRRLMFVHIDGDGFSSLAEWKGGKIGAIELKNRILEKYKIPTTFSVITGEIAPNGLYAYRANELEKAAKEIFALPWIEAASHTFSHPFDWLRAAYTKTGQYNLPIPNYHFNRMAETQGSLAYITKYLLSPEKKANVLLWSGLANPDEKTLAWLAINGEYNMNGYGTYITNALHSLSAIEPIGLRIGQQYQVYAPIANEEPYTNTWTGPFYGYERVIETLTLTDQPVRYKPLNLYYHVYSAIKPASLKALDKVYQWALTQAVYIIYASEYIKKANDFNTASIAIIDKGFHIRTNGEVRELRIPINMGYPDLLRSINVIGFNQYHDVYYIHLGTAKESILYLTKQRPTLPYLVSANGKIDFFQRAFFPPALVFRLKGHLPLNFEMANVDHCTLIYDKNPLTGKTTHHITQFSLPTENSHDIQVKC